MFRSIKKYLQPSKIIIVVNEGNTSRWIEWFSNFKFLLDDHDVTIIYRNDLITIMSNHLKFRFNGWILQNILKLVLCDIVNTEEYVLVDSKNFFIRPTSLINIKHRRGTDIFDGVDYNIGWISAVASKLSVPLVRLLSLEYKLLLMSAETPYIINTKYAQHLVKHFGGKDQFIEWFLRTSDNLFTCSLASPGNSRYSFISEFYLYELFCFLELGVKFSDRVDSNNWVMWNKKHGHHPKESLDQIPETIFVSGIHRDYLLESSKIEIDNIYKHFGLNEE